MKKQRVHRVDRGCIGFREGTHRGNIGVVLGFFGEDGKRNGNYYVGFP